MFQFQFKSTSMKDPGWVRKYPCWCFKSKRLNSYIKAHFTSLINHLKLGGSSKSLCTLGFSWSRLQVTKFKDQKVVVICVTKRLLHNCLNSVFLRLISDLWWCHYFCFQWTMALNSGLAPVVIEDSALEGWEVIDSGGFGQVHKARHQKWCCDVAIKLLHYDDG